MELTKEDLDKAIADLATKDDLKNLVTKADLDERLEKQTQALMDVAAAQTESLARIIKETVADPMEERFDRLDKTIVVAFRRIDTLENKVQKIEEALHITL